jgi:hypothetical protein
MNKFVLYIKRQVFPSLCADCKIKIAKKFHFASKIKHRIKRRGHKIPKGSKRYKQLLRNLAKARRARSK